MIHEYRTYTIHPGQLARYLDLANRKVVSVRGERYGRLVGFWWSEFGTYNQVHHIWEYSSLDSRQSLRKELAVNRDWADGFLAGAWPTMQVQYVRFMVPHTPVVPPTVRSLAYEARIYGTTPGHFTEVANAVAERPRGEGAHLVAVYNSETPQPNEVCELVAYASLDGRLGQHAQGQQQSAWLAQQEGRVLGITSTLLLPAAFSPLQ